MDLVYKKQAMLITVLVQYIWPMDFECIQMLAEIQSARENVIPRILSNSDIKAKDNALLTS